MPLIAENQRRAESLEVASQAAGGSGLLIGCAVLAGWALDIPLLVSGLPGHVAMKPNTALCLALLGLALWIQGAARAAPRTKRLASILTGSALVLGCLTLLESVGGWDFGIDQLLFREAAGAYGTTQPGRMGVNSSACIVLIAIAQFCLSATRASIIKCGQFLAAVSLLVALVAILGYAYAAPPLYGIVGSTHMAVHASLSLALLSLGTVVARRQVGITELIASEYASGYTMRRLMIAVVLIPATLGWLRLKGEQYGLYGFETGLTLMALSTMAAFVLVVWRHARFVHRIELERAAVAATLTDRNRLATLAAEVNAALIKAESVDEILGRCTELIVSRLDVAFARIWILIPGTDVLALRASAGLDTRLDGEHARILVGHHKIGRIACDRTLYLTNNVIGDPSICDPEWARREKMVAFAGHPLVVEGQLVGVMAVFSRSPLSSGFQNTLGLIADSVSSAVKRKQAEQHVAAREREFRDLADHLPDVVSRLDADLRYLYISPAVENVTGFPPSYYIGRTRAQAGVPESVARPWDAACTAALRTGRETDFEFHQAIRGDEERIYHSRIIPEFDEAQQPTSVLCVTSDTTDRRRAQATLEESERRYRELADALPQLIWTCRSDGTCDYANRQWLECIGAPPVDALRTGWSTVIHPDDRARAIAAWTAAVGRGSVRYDCEFRMRCADGSYRWFKSRATPLHDGQGRVVKWFGTSTDIDDQKRTEQALRESEASLARAQRIAHVGSWECEISSGRVTWSDETYRIFGLTPGSMMTPSFEAVIAFAHPDDRAMLQRVSNDAISSATGFDTDHRIVRPDGSIRIVNAQAQVLTDAGGRAIKLLGMVSDITERRRAEIALRESERFARSTVDALSTHIAIIDESGIIMAVNHAWEAFAAENGGDPAAVGPGTNYLAVCDAAGGDGSADVAEFAAAIRALIRNERSDATFEYSCHSPQENRWFLARASRFPGSGPTRVVIAHENMTDRRRTQIVEGERDHFRHAVKSMERVLGVVGHELRTPIAGIRAMSEFLLTEDARRTREWDTFLHSINHEVVRMAGIVNDLLEVARLNSGTARWNWGVVRMSSACAAAAESVRPLIDASSVRIETQVEPDDLHLSGDEAAITRLIINLLTNAARHTSQGFIRISCKRVAAAGGDCICMEIRDSGSGMSPQIAARLGQAFELNSGVIGESHVNGSGLGLAICKGIVAAHGGRISVQSAPERGTTIVAFLRCDLPAPEPSVEDDIIVASLET